MKSLKPAALALGMLSFIVSYSYPALAAETSAVTADALVDAALQADPTPAGRAGYVPAAGSAVTNFTPGAGPVLITTVENDHRGQIYDLAGQVKIGKKNGKEWQRAEKGMFIDAGDVLLTDKRGRVLVTFDQKFMNVVEVKENTRAAFKSIEPTDLSIEDGTVYNIFDSLPQNSNWKISTPTSVAAVRGTQFFVQYLATSGEMISANFEVADDDSLVTLIDILPDASEGASLNIPEGKSIQLAEDQYPDASHLSGINPAILREFKKILEKVMELRKKGQILPATAGEFETPPAFQEQILEDVVPPLDPEQDIKNVPPPQSPEVPQEEPPKGGGGEESGGGGEEGGGSGPSGCGNEC